MSEVHRYRGRLEPVDTEGLEIREWVMKALNMDELPSDIDCAWSLIQYLNEESTELYKFDYKDEVLYEVKREALNIENFSLGRKNEDGSYSFMVGYYDGTTDFDEVIQEMLEETN